MSEGESVSLSVVIISFNEEKNIARCINSVKTVADEITVVDSLSTDNTVRICRELGANVYTQAFLGHVEQKNFAISKARYPNILSLDADEALDEVLAMSILHAKKHWNYDGYSMNRLTNYCGKWIRHGGWYPDRKLRLWNSTKGKWKGVNPHDEFVLQGGCNVRHLDGDILHYSYNSISDHLAQVNYFTDILARASLQNGRKTGIIRILLSPVFKFIRDYLLKLGFLDGYYGLVISIISSHATFLKYAKMKQFRNESLKDAYSAQ